MRPGGVWFVRSRESRDEVERVADRRSGTGVVENAPRVNGVRTDRRCQPIEISCRVARLAHDISRVAAAQQVEKPPDAASLEGERWWKLDETRTQLVSKPTISPRKRVSGSRARVNARSCSEPSAANRSRWARGMFQPAEPTNAATESIMTRTL
jgi:hypothetical protein